jgi:hypothetical protein
VYGNTGFYYQPYNAINTALLLTALFVNGNHHHYYYGYGNWWNGGNWGNNGFYPWWAWNGHGHGYDPFFAYHHWHDGHNHNDWVNNVRHDFNRHQQQFADTRGQIVNGNLGGANHGGHGRPDHVNKFIKPVDQIARENRNLVLKQLNPNERQTTLAQAHDWQRIRDARTVAETNAAKNGGVNITGKPLGADMLRHGTGGGQGNRVAGQVGGKATAGDGNANGQARLRVDAPSGPRAAFQLPPSNNPKGNRVVGVPQGQGSQNANQNQNQASQLNQAQTNIRDQLNSRFRGGGGAGAGGNGQVDAAVRQFNRGNAAFQQQGGGQANGPQFSPRHLRSGNDAGAGSGGAAGAGANVAGNPTPQTFQAARPQIDFTGPRPRADFAPQPRSDVNGSGRQGQPGGGNPFRGSGPTNFGRLGNPQGGSVDAATQIFRGNPGGNSGGADMHAFRMPAGGGDSGPIRIPSNRGGGSSFHIPSGGQNFQSFRGGDSGGFRPPTRGNFNGGGGAAAIQGGAQFHNMGNTGGGNNDHRRDKRP